MDESNDTDKSLFAFLILMKVMSVQDSLTCLLSTLAQLRISSELSRNYIVLKGSILVAYMSDTTNAMKGVRSGVQKLIKNEYPNLLDVGCICHLADLTIKECMKPVTSTSYL